jgi:hypothetical protein
LKQHSRFAVARRFLIFWTLFIGIGAVGGSTAMLLRPDGSLMSMQGLLPYFQVLPFAGLLFQNYIFPGIALLCVNGLPNLISAVLMLRHKKAGVICGGIFGVTLMAWITIQFVIFPMNFMSTSYFIFGLLQAVTGYAAWVFYEQEHFTVDPKAYPRIGTNDKRLVVYFSRLGYTCKAAFEEAERSGAQLYEIRATERTEGTLGFWWCGRFGMHRWEMPIEPFPLDLSAYEHVTICTPVWVFAVCAPVRAFCKAARGKVREADYILLHFQNFSYRSVVKELDDLLGLSGSSAVSICSRQGHIKNCTLLPAEAEPKTKKTENA